jgi:hypothetical protein
MCVTVQLPILTFFNYEIDCSAISAQKTDKLSREGAQIRGDQVFALVRHQGIMPRGDL